MCSIPKFVGLALLSVLLALLGTLGGCQSTTGKTAGQAMSDESISTAVQTKLTSDRLSNFPRVDVDTERGVVNLSGVVETEAQRARAERLARQVDGVVKVNNNLQIQKRLPSETHTTTARPDDMKTAQPERDRGPADRKDLMQDQAVSVIEGDVVHVEGDTYFVRGLDGKEISLHVDTTTMKTERIKPGDRVEAKIDQNNHALSLLPAGFMDMKTE
jgi:hyperosmotically inducible periplasmic protein